MAGVKDFKLCFDTQLGNALGAGAQGGGGGDVNRVAVAKIERAAVQGADFGQQLLHMDEARHGANQVGVGAEVGGVLACADFQIAAHAGGQVDDDVYARITDAVHHLGIEGRVAAEFAGLGVAYMAVHHGGAGLGGLYRRCRNLRGRDWNGRVLADGVARAGQCAGNDDVGVHSA